MEAIAPKLIADDDDRVGVAAGFFLGLKAAAEDGMHSDRVEVVGRDEAAGCDLRVISIAQRRTRDRADEQVLA